VGKEGLIILNGIIGGVESGVLVLSRGGDGLDGFSSRDRA